MIRADMLLASEDFANPLMPNWWEALVTAVCFGVLMIVVVKKIVPAFENAYQHRVEEIEGGLQKAQKAQAEANAMMADYQQQLADARVEANRIREEARAEGDQIVAEARAKATEEATRISEHAQTQIAAERHAAVTSLRSEVGALATELASRIVGEALNDDARSQRVVDRFLADLEAEQNTSAGANN